MYILTKDVRDAFIKGLHSSYANLFEKKSIGNKEDILFGAIELYLSGTPFSNRGAHRQPRISDRDEVEEVLSPIVESIYKYFNTFPAPSSQSEFDKIHNGWCLAFRENCKKYVCHTYGSGQKFINILFKYLACYSDSEKFADWFKYSHMALDRYTYNGYKLPFYRDIVCAKRYGKRPDDLRAWSKMCEDEYLKISHDIAEHVANNPKSFNSYLDICHSCSVFTSIAPLGGEDDYSLTAFEAEFFLWAIAKGCLDKPASFVRSIRERLV